jgi:hypothetical protein
MNINNTHAVVRTLIIYALCIPLAVWLGFMLADPFDKTSFSYFGILALILIIPLLFRWHHFLLVATWNLGMTIFFLPGTPPIWLLMTVLSLGLSVLHRTINDKARFLSAPSLTWPLIFFMAVVLFTAYLTGGIGLHSLGSETAGGKNYFLVLGGILGYFAMTAQQIPPRRVKLYVSLFFLGGCTAFIGDLLPYLPSSFYYIYAFFPVNGYDLAGKPGTIDFNPRYQGLGVMGFTGFLFMLARFGPRGIFLSGKLWRPVVLALFAGLTFLGGFRSLIILCGSVFLIQGYLEGFHKTKIFPAFIFAGLIAASLLVPFAHTLPFTFQRALAFLPLKLDRVAREDAETTQAWRLQIWKDALPTVPQHLLLGKGYALSQGELTVASSDAFHYSSDIQSVDIVGSYHSGPLSVVIPFGIWGVIALLWFWIASLRALYFNYRYGDPGVRTVNIFLLAYFIAKVFEYLIIFGGLNSDMFYFCSIIGLSVSINGGIRRPAPATVRAVDKTSLAPLARSRFQPFYPS